MILTRKNNFIILRVLLSILNLLYKILIFKDIFNKSYHFYSISHATEHQDSHVGLQSLRPQEMFRTQAGQA